MNALIWICMISRLSRSNGYTSVHKLHPDIALTSLQYEQLISHPLLNAPRPVLHVVFIQSHKHAMIVPLLLLAKILLDLGRGCRYQYHKLFLNIFRSQHQCRLFLNTKDK